MLSIKNLKACIILNYKLYPNKHNNKKRNNIDTIIVIITFVLFP